MFSSLIGCLRTLLADCIYYTRDKTLQEIIDGDVYRYLKWNTSMSQTSKIRRLNHCLLKFREYRNVFYFRIQNSCRFTKVCKVFLKPADGVEIGGEIGKGLFISHHHAVVCPKNAGRNLRIGPGVVIGKNRGAYPHIGNNVYIASNATVIGGISIGDNVIIGAGSVVTKDIPSDSICIGNPARLLRHISDEPEMYDEIQ